MVSSSQQQHHQQPPGYARQSSNSAMATGTSITSNNYRRLRIRGNRLLRIRNVIVFVSFVGMGSLFYMLHVAHYHLDYNLENEKNAAAATLSSPLQSKQGFYKTISAAANSKNTGSAENSTEQKQQQQPPPGHIATYDHRNLLNTSGQNKLKNGNDDNNNNNNNKKIDKFEIIVPDANIKQREIPEVEKLRTIVKKFNAENQENAQHQNRGRGPRHPQKQKEKKRNVNFDQELPRPAVGPWNPLEKSIFENNTQTKEKLQYERDPTLKYFGVLLDAGRHYFPIDWIERMLTLLSLMHFNFLHFRLTDDQTFNIQLNSHPKLSYPTVVDNVDRKTYTIDEIKHIIKYAKNLGFSIMPEINIPGHAGSWAGIDHGDLIVKCPNFICSKGYGVPLNVTNPKFFTVLKNVLKEVIDIFDNPPYIHLGGDEVHMALPCFQEIGFKSIFDYTLFENELKAILKELSYPEEQVLRWEVTGQSGSDPSTRAGKVLHFWESEPGERYPATDQFFISRHFYFDSNKEVDGYENYLNTKRLINDLPNKWRPVGIIAGTFELSTEYWFDRNVLGRLLSMYIGAINEKGQKDIRRKYGSETTADVLLAVTNDANSMNLGTLEEDKFKSIYSELCSKLGFHINVCNLFGRPTIPTSEYTQKWQKSWNLWKFDICNRITDSIPTTSFNSLPSQNKNHAGSFANDYFWTTFGTKATCNANSINTTTVSASDLQSKQQYMKRRRDTAATASHNDFADTTHNNNGVKSSEEQERLLNQLLFDVEDYDPASDDNKKNNKMIGVILDLVVNKKMSFERIQYIIQNIMTPLGMNTLQLRLISGHGFVVEIPALQSLHVYYNPLMNTEDYNENPTANNNDDTKKSGRKPPPRLASLYQHRRTSSRGLALGTKQSPAGVIYSYEQLRSIVNYAGKFGIEVLPEISVSTTAGGWINTGFMIDCGSMFCRNNTLSTDHNGNPHINYFGGNAMINDIHHPQFLPVVYAVIRELYEIFSSKYFHLGSDERLLGVQCLEKTSQGPADDIFFEKETSGKFDPKFYFFENKLRTVLELIGISEEYVLRYENEENFIYDNRAGNVTHYKSIDAKFGNQGHAHKTKEENEVIINETFFSQISLFPGNLWDIYQRAREWIDGIPVDGHPQDKIMTPKGILAEIQFLDEQKWEIDFQISYRLLAYRIGTLTSLPAFTTKEDFESKFLDFCIYALHWEKCNQFFEDNNNNDSENGEGNPRNNTDLYNINKGDDRIQLLVEKSSYRKQICDKYTYEHNIYVMKEEIL